MEHLCTLKKEGSGYSLELSFDSTKAALDAALEILAFADADCYLAGQSKPNDTTTPTQNEYKIPFKHLLRDFRRAHGYTQAEASRLLGVSPNTICSWELGHKTPPSQNRTSHPRKIKQRRVCK